MADLDGSFIPALQKPSSLLPIAKYRRNLLYAIEANYVTILIGETGSGKTTQLPQFLESAGWCADGKLVGVTQPRRIAAKTVATRVADEMRCRVGEEVGYSIRFEDVTSSKTRIKFLTDGLLLREALVDPLLTRYSVIMVDEAHERSLSTDVLLGVLKKIQKRRPELKIIVSSATIQAKDFLVFFAGDADYDVSSEVPKAVKCSIVSIEGRTYPVDILYLQDATEEYVEKSVQTAFEIHKNEGEGDILVFLTGREEIETAIEMLSERAATIPPKSQGLVAYPLYAGLSADEQMYVFEPAPDNTRKVIVSTNIAEASVTIDGVVYVVDCGFAKLRAYNSNTGIETLTAVPLSKASATQRAGRAGRTRPGKCFRLYTEDSCSSMSETGTPEIQRSNMAPLVLQLKALGIDNIAKFDFLSPPPSQLVTRGLELLYSLKALDEYAKLTKPLGSRMAELAVEPMMARVLLDAHSFSCLSEILSIAAMVSLQSSPFFSHTGEARGADLARRKFAVEEGDHMTLLNIYHAFVSKGKKDARWSRENSLNHSSMTRAVSIRSQLKRYLENFGLNVDESSIPALSQGDSQGKSEQIRRCLTTGYFGHAAKMQPDGSFKTVNCHVVLHAHPSSLMFVSVPTQDLA
ncbi:MAG: hypothetical protein Q9160_004008 [Pyrenula sp. 1 TL-2023]